MRPDDRTAAREPTVAILIADDHCAVRAGIHQLIAAHDDLNVVGEAADRHEAVIMARTLRPTIVIMDLSMPRLDGIEATRAILDDDPHVRVIGISRERDRPAIAALRGAGGLRVRLEAECS
jgi:DNA-binding NarL/FixJ family response regulator